MLKNLLSNAFKFTEHGGVRMHVGHRHERLGADHPILEPGAAVVEFSVSDTGIGIPPEKQRIIFEAFQQADAGTSRKYGGTGLGLAISRELAHLLGGEIRLTSVAGQRQHLHALSAAARMPGRLSRGTSMRRRRAGGSRRSSRVLPMRTEEQIPDDRDDLGPRDPMLLIVEDDPHYARVLLSLARDAASRDWWPRTGAEALDLRAHTSRWRSRWTCSCPTCSAGPS